MKALSRLASGTRMSLHRSRFLWSTLFREASHTRSLVPRTCHNVGSRHGDGAISPDKPGFDANETRDCKQLEHDGPTTASIEWRMHRDFCGF